MLTTVPFSGFYNSFHDSEIDQTIERMFSDPDTGTQNNAGLESALFKSCDFRKVHNAYATDYVENFAEEFKIASLKFESLQSPKEYNFTTDIIFANISIEDINFIRDTVDETIFFDLAKERFTSRSGFMSFYDPDVKTWGDIETWDHNQCGCLLSAYADDVNGDFDNYAEYALMEKSAGNGYIENSVCSATPNIDRLYRIHEYLNARNDR